MPRPRIERRTVALLALVVSCKDADGDPADAIAGETTSTPPTASTVGDDTTSTDPTTTQGTAGDVTSGEATSSDTTSGDVTTRETTSGDATSGDTTSGGAGLELPWTWIAAIDQGIRDDDYGLGHFRAPRDGYEHSGIDFLMPVGTTLMSPCEGVYLADYDGGYGNWVQVICPVPSTITGGATVFASMLFAHLDATALPTTGIDPAAAGPVDAGELIGTSGKTGNASASGIHAHLHFEIALHGSQLDGLNEAHISGSDGDTPAAAALRDGLTAACLEPTGFAPIQSTLNLGRRVDPFIFLTCLSAEKPALEAPQLQALHPWSDDYSAASFDVDVGM